jgi:hypothetical protein
MTILKVVIASDLAFSRECSVAGGDPETLIEAINSHLGTAMA